MHTRVCVHSSVQANSMGTLTHFPAFSSLLCRSLSRCRSWRRSSLSRASASSSAVHHTTAQHSIPCTPHPSPTAYIHPPYPQHPTLPHHTAPSPPLPTPHSTFPLSHHTAPSPLPLYNTLPSPHHTAHSPLPRTDSLGPDASPLLPGLLSKKPHLLLLLLPLLVGQLLCDLRASFHSLASLQVKGEGQTWSPCEQQVVIEQHTYIAIVQYDARRLDPKVFVNCRVQGGVHFTQLRTWASPPIQPCTPAISSPQPRPYQPYTPHTSLSAM